MVIGFKFTFFTAYLAMLRLSHDKSMEYAVGERQQKTSAPFRTLTQAL